VVFSKAPFEKARNTAIIAMAVAAVVGRRASPKTNETPTPRRLPWAKVSPK